MTAQRALAIALAAALAGLSGCATHDTADAPDACVVAGCDDTPDAGAMVDAGGTPVSCDPVSQLGCGAAEKCTVMPGAGGADARLTCVVAAGDRGLGEACTLATPTTPDNCLPGMLCRGADAPRCLEFCTAAPVDTCSGNQVCAIDEDIDDDGRTDVRMCVPSCDPLAQDCADSRDGCYPSGDGTLCAPEGAGDPPVGDGDICEYANSCARGLGCFRFGFDADFTCHLLCNPDGVSDPKCKPAQVCNRVDNEDWGICIEG